MTELTRGQLVKKLGFADSTKEGLLDSATHSAFSQNGKLTVEDSDFAGTVLLKSSTEGSEEISLTASTGMSIETDHDTQSVIITNSSPDQTVTLTGAGIVACTGTYPDFTVTGTEADTLATVVGRGSVTHAGANYSEFEADGTLCFHGDATVWDDLRITPGSFDRPGIADPAYVIYYPNGGGLGTYLPEFAIDDFASFTVQMPHGYKAGSNLSVHLHWTPRDRGNEESGKTVGWKVDYSWANIDGTFGDMQTADLSDACDGTDHKHQMTPQVAITGTSKAISSMLLCNIRRSDTGTDDTWVSTTSGQLPLLLEVDFHYEIDTVGSRSISSK